MGFGCYPEFGITTIMPKDRLCRNSAVHPGQGPAARCFRHRDASDFGITVHAFRPERRGFPYWTWQATPDPFGEGETT